MDAYIAFEIMGDGGDLPDAELAAGGPGAGEGPCNGKCGKSVLAAPVETAMSAWNEMDADRWTMLQYAGAGGAAGAAAGLVWYGSAKGAAAGFVAGCVVGFVVDQVTS